MFALQYMMGSILSPFIVPFATSRLLWRRWVTASPWLMLLLLWFPQQIGFHRGRGGLPSFEVRVMIVKCYKKNRKNIWIHISFYLSYENSAGVFFCQAVLSSYNKNIKVITTKFYDYWWDLGACFSKTFLKYYCRY